VIKKFFSEKTVFIKIGFATGKNSRVETGKTSYVMGKTSFKIFKNRFWDRKNRFLKFLKRVLENLKTGF